MTYRFSSIVHSSIFALTLLDTSSVCFSMFEPSVIVHQSKRSVSQPSPLVFIIPLSPHLLDSKLRQVVNLVFSPLPYPFLVLPCQLYHRPFDPLSVSSVFFFCKVFLSSIFLSLSYTVTEIFTPEAKSS